MAILTHGTTEQGLKAILSGSGKTLCSLWDCSDRDDYMYFYDAKDVAEDYGRDEDEDGTDDAVRQSLENAQLQLVTEGAGGKIFSLVCEVPDDLIELDDSCPNMQHARRIECEKFDPKWIVAIYTHDVNIWSLPFILSSVITNDLVAEWNVSSELWTMAKLLSDNGVYMPDEHHPEPVKCEYFAEWLEQYK